MDLSKHIAAALDAPMDRREFLARVGLVALALSGIVGALKAFHLPGRDSSVRRPDPAAVRQALDADRSRPGRGYGSTPYGS